MEKRVIKSVNDNQHAILRDIMDLHNGGRPFEADMTYSIGNFYGEFTEKVPVKNDDGTVTEINNTFEIPQPKFKFDVMPQVDGVEKIDPWGPWPLEDNSLESIVLDPPFIVSSMSAPSMFNGKDDSNMISKRFASFYPRYELFDTYEHLITEAYRVLKPMGILVLKTQATVSGSIQLMTPYFSCVVANNLGFYTLDEFILTTKVRMISGKVKNQQHARKYHSFFYVFQKDNPKKDKIGYWKRDYVRDADRVKALEEKKNNEKQNAQDND